MKYELLSEITVVIPCYRCAETIGRAVASVAAQTLRPVEVILIDDCSGDETWAVLQLLQQQYDHGWIKLIAQPENMGPGSARNAGWKIASQPYIAFLDADDAWHPKKIEIQYGWMRTHSEIAITGHARRIISEPSQQMAEELSTNQAAFRQIRQRELLLSNYFLTPSVMLKRDLPYRFAPGKRHCEDYLLWCEILIDKYPCCWSPLPLAFLFKAPYGEAGLSANLWAMFKGGLDAYTRLYRTNRIGRIKLAGLHGWLLVRYLRRIIKARLLPSREWK